MSDELKLETRVVVLSLELPENLWRILEATEEASGTSISDHFTNVIRMSLLKTVQQAQELLEAVCHQSN